MAFDKINYSNATSNILAMAIQDDARDTLSKITEAYAALSPLLGSEAGEIIDHDDYQALINYLGQGVTLVLEDGDCVTLQVVDGVVKSISSGIHADNNIETILIDASGKINNDAITDLSGQYNWSFDELIQSLAHQAQSATVFSRLAGICASQDVRQADIMSCFYDVSHSLTPDVQALRSNLLNLGANLSQTSVLSMLQSSYTSISDASADNNTITFAENDFRVEGFCGTILKDMLVSASTVLGQMLLVSGGIIGKIAGVAMIGVGIVSNVISTAANAMTSTEATYNAEASQYEFAQRLFKGKVNKSYVNSVIINKINQDRICLLRYPAFNLYIWQNPSENNAYYYEAYASLMLNRLPTYSHEGVDSAMYRVTASTGSSGARKSLYVSMDARATTGSSNIGTYPFIEAANYFGADNGTYSQWLETPSDEEMRRRVTLSVAAAAFQMLSLRRYTSGDVDQYLPRGFLLREGADADAPEDNWVDILWNFFVRGKIPSWEGLVNYAIPELQTWHDVIPETPRALGLFSGHGSDGIVSMDGSLSSCPSFRSSYLVTPPKYTQGAIIGAISITLGAAAALTATYFVGRAIATRIITKQSVKRYDRVQQKLKEWQEAEGPDKEKALNSYLKEVRKYNKFAKITGMSTINSVDGYQNGDDVSYPQISDSTVNTLLKLINDFQDDSNSSFSKIKSLISKE